MNIAIRHLKNSLSQREKTKNSKPLVKLQGMANSRLILNLMKIREKQRDKLALTENTRKLNFVELKEEVELDQRILLDNE